MSNHRSGLAVGPSSTSADHLQFRSPETARPGQLPSLDGWRAVSIMMVLGWHSWAAANLAPTPGSPLNWVFNGDLGVRFFFSISGFLITWLMLVEHKRTGRVHLGHFYARRCLRILPVYFAFLGVLWILQMATPFRQTPRGWLSNLTFTTNFVPASFTSSHLWSLSVEEQFYLIWPGLFVMCGVARNFRAAIGVLVSPLLIAPVWRMLTFKQSYPQAIAPLFSHFSFFNYFDSLAIGCIAAVALSYRPEVCFFLRGRSGLTALVGLILLALPRLRLPLPGRVTYAVTPTLEGVGFALLLLHSVSAPQWGPYRMLNWAVVRRVGVLSYSIYIWQQIFCTNPATFGLGRVWWMSFPGWLLPVMVASTVSYYAFERPLLALRRHFRDTGDKATPEKMPRITLPTRAAEPCRPTGS